LGKFLQKSRVGNYTNGFNCTHMIDIPGLIMYVRLAMNVKCNKIKLEKFGLRALSIVVLRRIAPNHVPFRLTPP